MKIKKYIQARCKNGQFIDTLKLLKHKDFAVDGIHLNRGGKSKLCSKLRSILFGTPPSPTTTTNDQQVLSEPPSLSEISSPDLITLHDYEEDHYTQQHPHQESITVLPETSLVDAPIPCDPHIGTLLQGNPINYRLTNISMHSFSNNTVHSSPNPVPNETPQPLKN